MAQCPHLTDGHLKDIFEEERAITTLEDITKQLNNLLPSYTLKLQRLIQFDSVQGNESAIQDFMYAEFERLQLAPQVYFCRHDNQSKNIAAILHGTDGSNYRSLVLNAHCDVAPIDDAKRWQRDPFTAVVDDGRIYGRGAQDDKAGLAILLMITEALKNLGIKLKGDLILQSVIEDETSGNGTKVLTDNGFTGDGVIICDGTWPQRIIYSHLGQVWLNATIIGEPVAACVESRGINPIYIGVEFIQKLRSKFATLKPQSHFEGLSDAIFVNVGSFESGSWHGSVPSQARIKMQIGFADIWSLNQIVALVKDLAASVSERIIIDRDSLNTEFYRTDPQNLLITKLKKIVDRNSTTEALVVPVTGHCDLRHFATQMACLYGPGGGKNAHGMDEYYILADMPTVAQNILEFAAEWCNELKLPTEAVVQKGLHTSEPFR